MARTRPTAATKKSPEYLVAAAPRPAHGPLARIVHPAETGERHEEGERHVDVGARAEDDPRRTPPHSPSASIPAAGFPRRRPSARSARPVPIHIASDMPWAAT